MTQEFLTFHFYFPKSTHLNITEIVWCKVMCPRDKCIKMSQSFLAGNVLPFLSDEYSINEWHEDISSVDIINQVVLYAEESESEKDKISLLYIECIILHIQVTFNFIHCLIIVSITGI